MKHATICYIWFKIEAHKLQRCILDSLDWPLTPQFPAETYYVTIFLPVYEMKELGPEGEGCLPPLVLDPPMSIKISFLF